MKKISIWTDGIKDVRMDSLKENIECDILVIGGGIAGLSTVYNLKDHGKRIILIDKNKCGMGATSCNTGKLTFMQDLIYHDIESNYNEKVARLYLNSQKEAINIITSIIKKEKIDCDLTKTNAYVFSNDEDKYKNFDKEIEFYKKNNIRYKVLSSLPLNYPSKMVLETYDSYVFNPYKYLIGLKRLLKDKISIYENTRAIRLDKKNDYYLCTTSDNYEIKSKVVVVASHYPFFIVPYFTPFKTRVEKFFIGASFSNDSKNIQMISNDKPGISMRYYKKNNNKHISENIGKA